MRLRARRLGLGLLCLVAMASLYALGVRTRWGQQVDAAVMTAMLGVSGEVLGRATGAFARTSLILGLACLFAVLVPLALARLRWGAVAAAIAVPASSIPAAYKLRDSILTRPDLEVHGYDFNTYPSTHAATAIALLVAVLLLWPRPLDHRDLSRGGFVVSLVLVGNVTSYAHRPADVLGSLLLVCASTLAAIAISGFRPPKPRRRRARPIRAPR